MKITRFHRPVRSRVSPFRAARRWFVALAALAGIASGPAARAVTPAPGGGYPGQNTALGLDALRMLDTGQYNTALGAAALFLDNIGNDNTACGVSALSNNKDGSNNTATGFSALVRNSSGIENTALGSFALLGNTTRNDNTAAGNYAMAYLVGTENVAVGATALLGGNTSNPGGDGNVAVGRSALHEHSSGDYNVAVGQGTSLGFSTAPAYDTSIGFMALSVDQSGYGNTASGARALRDNSDGVGNTADGVDTLTVNQSGGSNTARGFAALHENTGTANTADGVDALFHNTTGSFDTASGGHALTANTTGANNAAFGFQALNKNTTASNNTALGVNALAASTGGNNIAVGNGGGSSLTTGSNNIDIGSKGVAAEAATIRLGTVGTQKNAYVAGISGVTVASGVAVVIDANGHLGTMTSSARFKEDIRPMDTASEAVLALRPVTFRYRPELDPEGIPQFGLVAEEVEKVSPDLVARDAEGKVFTVRYDAVNAMLLNEFLKQREEFQKERRRDDWQADALMVHAADIAELRAALTRRQESVARPGGHE